MVQTHSKRQKSIRSKLVAAICMLLVSSIMMVSSTYAWFTLSTAPEVTGISTAVGANGNLEMALQPLSGNSAGIESAVGDSTAAVDQRNTTWGNLVELGTEGGYGLDKIVLNPAQLNVIKDEQDPTNIALNITSPLATPAYGYDGRVSSLVAQTITATYGNNSFPTTNARNFGVRAVGNASGMTDRQLSYRSALSDGNTAIARAKSAAAASLEDNGSALAGIAIIHAADANATFTQADVTSLLSMVSGTTSALNYIEEAYLHYIVALFTSDKNTETGDTIWSTVKGWTEESGATLAGVLTKLTGEYSNSAVTNLTTISDALTVSKGKVATAKAALEALVDTSANPNPIPWSSLSAAMQPLVDTSVIEVNGYKISEVKDNISELFNGVVISMPTGGGVYADIADHCGDYDVDITLGDNVEYNGISLKGMTVAMKAETTLSAAYSTQMRAAVGNMPVAATGTEMPITDFYGYVIDLAFRTNAANSNLLLQVDAVDRIYEDNAADAATMGHGSTMTFTRTDASFGYDKVVSLMGALRLVFFDTDTGNIYAYGKLNTEDAVVDNGVTADIQLYTPSGSATTKTVYNQVASDAAYDSTESYFVQVSTPVYSYSDPLASLTDVTEAMDDGFTVCYKTSSEAADSTYALLESKPDALTDGYVYAVRTESAEISYTAWAPNDENTTDAEEFATEITSIYVAEQVATTTTEDTVREDVVITSLTQNTAKEVSVLVYLDGANITNADVAAEVATSMTGTMNLQFASSAKLEPMEYAALHQSTASEDNGSNTQGNG